MRRARLCAMIGVAAAALMVILAGPAAASEPGLQPIAAPAAAPALTPPLFRGEVGGVFLRGDVPVLPAAALPGDDWNCFLWSSCRPALRDRAAVSGSGSIAVTYSVKGQAVTATCRLDQWQGIRVVDEEYGTVEGWVDLTAVDLAGTSTTQSC